MSLLLNLSYIGASTSISATTSLSLIIGTTISLLDNDEQAICPLNSLTLGTIMVSFFSNEVPHTPFPLGIIVQATSPWKGPKYNLSPLTKYPRNDGGGETDCYVGLCPPRNDRGGVTDCRGRFANRPRNDGGGVTDCRVGLYPPRDDRGGASPRFDLTGADFFSMIFSVESEEMSGT